MIFAGIDIAKHRHGVCLVDNGGNVVFQMYMDNSKKGLDKLFQNLNRLKIEATDVQFCLEAIGHYWLGIYCHLTDLGYKVHIINPIQSDALRNFH